jgi:hypothetical protein
MRVTLIFLIFSLALCNAVVFAHGGVAFEEDNCVINIGFLKAHFTSYQPNARGNKEFCEDIPDVAESVFVIDYLHDFLNQIQVDFRIIEDVNNFGVFAKWADIQTLPDIDADTVFYQPPMRRPGGVMTVEYNFEKAGSYIGIVTAQHPTEDKVYRAVFQFQVGGRPYGYVPLILFFVVLAQLTYWVNGGGLKRFRQRRSV